MKRYASLAVVLLAWLVVAGCAGEATRPTGAPSASGDEATARPSSGVTSVSSAACGQVVPTLEPERAGPGEAFSFSGAGFGGGCDDSNLPFEPEPAQQDVRIEMRQGGKAWHLATVDAGGPPDYGIEKTLEVPEDAEPGGALVVTNAAEDAEDGDPFLPLRVPFEVLGAPAADRGPAGTGSTDSGDRGAPNGGREEPVASGAGSASAYACAPDGAPPVDLAVEGTVREVRVGPGFSLAEIRVERVLEGHAGDTVFVRTNSGTHMSVADDVVFEEGARYRLGLQREDVGRGNVYSTNFCLGNERLE